MKKILEVSKIINEIFIRVILFFFYYIVIGLISVIYRIFKSKKRKSDTYWQDVSGEKFDSDYFNSAY